jgi:hypothetical protein
MHVLSFMSIYKRKRKMVQIWFKKKKLIKTSRCQRQNKSLIWRRLYGIEKQGNW